MISIRYKKILKRHTGAEGIARKIRNYIRYYTMFFHVCYMYITLSLSERARIYQVYSVNELFVKKGKIKNLFKAFTGNERSEEEILSRVKIPIESKMYKVYDSARYIALQAHRLVLKSIESKYNANTAVELFEKIHAFREKIVFMQSRIRMRLMMNKIRVEIFISKWNKLAYQIITLAQSSKDEKMKNFGMEIVKIPEHIKKYVA